MSNLVERLRAYASDDHERGCQGRYYDCSCGYDGKRDPLIDEAADRIEQLEAALQRIDRMEVYEADAAVVLWAKIGIMRDIARAALGEERT